MDKNEFSILQNISTGQFLVDTTFNHDKEEFELSIKFWAKNINGYATIKHHWSEDKEQFFRETFDKFKSVEYCEKWVKAVDNQSAAV